MKRLTLLAPAILGLPALLGGAPSIGTVVSDGRFSVNHMQVPGSATLFEGSLVESQKSSVTIQLSGGPRIDLAAGSAGTVYKDRMVLRGGVARAKMGTGYRIETRDLVLQPTLDASTAMVRIANQGNATVSVPQGQMKVSNAKGLLLARLTPGVEVDYGQQSSQESAAESKRVQLTGTLQQKEGHYLLQDRATEMTWELVGKVPSSEVGKTVTVLGYAIADKPVAPADHMARIDSSRKALGGFPCIGGGGGPDGQRIQLSGPIEKNGEHYLLTDQVSKVVSELVGKVPTDVKNGTVITVKGTLVKDSKPFSPALQVIDVDHSKVGAGVLLTGCQKALIAGAAVAAAGIISGFEFTQGPSTPVSQ